MVWFFGSPLSNLGRCVYFFNVCLTRTVGVLLLCVFSIFILHLYYNMIVVDGIIHNKLGLRPSFIKCNIFVYTYFLDLQCRHMTFVGFGTWLIRVDSLVNIP